MWLHACPKSLGAFLNLSRAQVLDMRGNAPNVSERIGDGAVAIAPEHVSHRHDYFAACLHGLLHGFVYIGDIQVQRSSSAAQGLRRLAGSTGKFVSQENDRIADLQFGMTYRASRAFHAHEFLSAECPLVKINCLGRPADHQMRRNGLESFRNWACCTRHKM